MEYINILTITLRMLDDYGNFLDDAPSKADLANWARDALPALPSPLPPGFTLVSWRSSTWGTVHPPFGADVRYLDEDGLVVSLTFATAETPPHAEARQAMLWALAPLATSVVWVGARGSRHLEVLEAGVLPSLASAPAGVGLPVAGLVGGPDV